VEYLKEFASYRFHLESGKTQSIPMVCLGRPPLNQKNFEPKDIQKANIQDWWSDYIHPHFKNALCVPLKPPQTEAKTNKITNNAFLYTLEWINPHPSQKLTHIEVHADPARSTSLGILAVTAVLIR
jgi:hypothetical protein